MNYDLFLEPNPIQSNPKVFGVNEIMNEKKVIYLLCSALKPLFPTSFTSLPQTTLYTLGAGSYLVLLATALIH